MSGKERRIFWGHTLPEAVANAARYHGVDPTELSYHVIERKHGFVRIRRRVLIEVELERLGVRFASEKAAANGGRAEGAHFVSVQSPGTASKASEQRVVEGFGNGAEGGFDPVDEEVRLAAHEALLRILRLAGVETTFSFGSGSERLEVELGGVPFLGEEVLPFLEAVEHLLARAIFYLAGKRVQVSVDSSGFRAARVRELEELARKGLQALEKGRKEVDLGPLSAWERWVVHRFLAGEPGVRSEGVGEGPYRRLRIRRVNGSEQGSRPPEE